MTIFFITSKTNLTSLDKNDYIDWFIKWQICSGLNQVRRMIHF